MILSTMTIVGAGLVATFTLVMSVLFYLTKQAKKREKMYEEESKIDARSSLPPRDLLKRVRDGS
jgi:hypothetical protein